MASKIEQYKASYPLAFYEIGTVYSFYGHPEIGSRLASDEQIKRFAATLKAVGQEKSAQTAKHVSGGNTSFANKRLNRYYAVVVNKVNTSSPMIEVMFCVKVDGHDEYALKFYIVNKGCFMDGKELMPVSTSVEGIRLLSKTRAAKKGGITLDENSTKKGGITLDEGSPVKTRGVGGIALDEIDNQHEANQNGDNRKSLSNHISPGRVGGITLDEN